MTTRFHARYDGKAIIPEEALDLPLNEPLELEVRTIASGAKDGATSLSSQASFAELPFFGMWEDREDMPGGVQWVRDQRASWRRRLRQAK